MTTAPSPSSVVELHDRETAQRYLLQGFCRQSVLPPSAARVPEVLNWALEIAAAGEPLPPLGVVADLGHLVFGTTLASPQPPVPIPGWPAALTRTYEDTLLGRLFVDASFERGAAGVARYRGRDRARGLAFLVNALRQRAGLEGVLLHPGTIKALAQHPDEFLPQAWNSFERDGILPLLMRQYEELSLAVRNVGSVLAPEDVFELEHRTALMQFGDRLALRQVLQAADLLEESLPRQPRRTGSSVQPVPTHVLDEDTYPVGGFSSISNRGSIESLLHSQLAYMDKAGEGDRPDLFDIKFLRDELLFYSRDENQFFRRRRQFIFAFPPDLVHSRVKDQDVPWQRIILALAFVVAAVRRLTEWLGQDALVFRMIFLQKPPEQPVLAERTLLELLFREQIANRTVLIDGLLPGDLGPLCQSLGRTALTQVFVISTATALKIDGVTVHSLQVGQRPRINDPPPDEDLERTPVEAWQQVTQALLSRAV
jgi:hypothetical protein